MFAFFLFLLYNRKRHFTYCHSSFNNKLRNLVINRRFITISALLNLTFVQTNISIFPVQQTALLSALADFDIEVVQHIYNDIITDDTYDYTKSDHVFSDYFPDADAFTVYEPESVFIFPLS